MLKTISVRNTLLMFLAASFALASCKNGGLLKKKKAQSSVTGWNYDDKDFGNFHVLKAQEQKTGPGLVFIQGGTFVMGSKEEDVMGDWNNVPRRVSVNSFYMDETEVANVHYREYLYWLSNTFDNDTTIMDMALPDTLVWRSELAYNEPYVKYYFRYPAYNYYPVVGVTWEQAHDFCVWRSDRVNEKILIDKGYINKKAPMAAMRGGEGDMTFNTDTYLMDPDQINNKTAPKKGALKDVSGKPRKVVTFEDGILLPSYRLPTEAEWEYAAYGLILQNPKERTKEKNRGEELFLNQQVYSWNKNVNGLRDSKRGSWQGEFLANFKRGNGDVMGVAGGLNDRAAIPGPIKAFYPNGFGLYNMAGNVSEWVADVYRSMSSQDVDDINPYRGNKFTQFYKNSSSGEYERDTLGHLKLRVVTDAEASSRRNYQKGDVINYLDGDSISNVTYGYGVTTLVSDKSRVIKGGSWDDMPYWLSPGARRYMEQDQASSTVGFRCAMTRLGSPEGNGLKEGNIFGTRKQNNKKRR